ncbi:uncharacterized protein LOC124276384 [Haliotis rubra]|uniref:uncharacterized protein LOC124276384 n=1 Tax=Haliotis rubra TaxID=36100 RepID=UPI001EE4F7E0|nr:uncharacterized protein LOC124276384 [Haliotis rubra]
MDAEGTVVCTRTDAASATTLRMGRPAAFEDRGSNDSPYPTTVWAHASPAQGSQPEETEWCISQRLPGIQIMHYLDDFLTGGSQGTTQCQANLQTSLAMLTHLGIPIAHDKTVGPASKLTFLGLEIDTLAMQVRIPEGKIREITSQIQHILFKPNSKVTRKELQSLIGKLNFICRAIPMGRAFCRRLIDLLCQGKQPFHHIRITEWVKQDLHMWLTFLTKFNGVSVFQDQLWVDNSHLQLYTDASGSTGFGAYLQGEWFCGRWPDQWVVNGTTLDMTFLELFPIVLAIKIWGPQLANKKILFYCDNQAVVAIINKQSSKCPVMNLLRRLILLCFNHNILFKSKYIDTNSNVIADALSRFQFDRFRAAAPEAKAAPTPIPDTIWQI